MMHRLITTIVATLVAGCIVVPAALGAEAKQSTTTDASAKTALAMLAKINGIHIGLNSTTITIKDGAKSHPIVIDYSEALKTGASGASKSGSTAAAASGGTGIASPLPKGLGIGQIAAWLLGLTLVSRVVGIVRQVLPHSA